MGARREISDRAKREQGYPTLERKYITRKIQTCDKGEKEEGRRSRERR